MRRNQPKLVPCPLCGADEGYKLYEGSTIRWWSVCCASCEQEISEARKANPEELTPRTRPADEVWNKAEEYAERMRIGHQRYETARKMNPQQWATAWQRNITTSEGFDQIIDEQTAYFLECNIAGGAP
jgi:hypothetical protein